jgi:hypothetical protein
MASADPIGMFGAGDLTYIVFVIGWEADDRIDRQSRLSDPKVAPDGLPALAFCLLFRFQGAEALSGTSTGAL